MSPLDPRKTRPAKAEPGPWLLCVLALLAGCQTWRAGNTEELRPSADPPGRLLIVTKDRAFELDQPKLDFAEVSGIVRDSWVLPGGLPEAESARWMTSGDQWPNNIAERLGWKRVPTGLGEHVRLLTRDVLYVRVYDSNASSSSATTFLLIAAGVIAGLYAGAFLFGALLTSCGRPLRVRGRQVITRAGPGNGASGWTKPIALAPVEEHARRTLAEVWTLEARGEHAAVAAFAKTSLELMALGAPPDLIVRTSRAAIQEVEHARLCFAVASAYSGEIIEPAALPEALAGDTPDLLRLARESLLDGCLREGLASQIADLGADRARDPQIVRVLRVQAKEETQHAELSWAIVDWAIERGGDSMRRSLLAAVDKMEFPRCDDLPEHGRIGRTLVAPLFDEIRARARERLGAVRCAAAA
jgi:hypothetical protein